MRMVSEMPLVDSNDLAQMFYNLVSYAVVPVVGNISMEQYDKMVSEMKSVVSVFTGLTADGGVFNVVEMPSEE